MIVVVQDWTLKARKRIVLMLPTPQFYSSPSLARKAVHEALKGCDFGCTVNDVLVRVDPDGDRWFGIVSLNTDTLAVLSAARKVLPEFRVIGEPLRRESGTQAARQIQRQFQTSH